jgi:iron(III) transport system permease protein
MTVTMDRPPVPAVPPPSGPPPATRQRRPRLRKPAGRTVLNTVVILVLIYLVIGPFLTLFVTAFEDTSAGVFITPPYPWTGANFSAVFGHSETYSVLGTTLLFSAGALIFAFAVSMTFAWLVERTDLPLRNSMFVLLVAPQGIPGVIMGVSWSLLLNPTNGMVNLGLRHITGESSQGPLNVYSLPWMIIVEGMKLVPLTFLLVSASLRGMNASLEEAARASGASFGTVVRRVTLPLLKPALVGALIYEFVAVVETVDIPLLLGVPGHVKVLSTQIYFAAHPAVGLPNYGLSATYGGFLLILALIPIAFYNRIVKSGSYATVTGKTFRPKVQKLGRWKPVAVVVTWAYICVSLFVPFLVLVWTSLQPYVSEINAAAFHRLTFKAYGETLTSDLFTTALKNTLLVAFFSAAMAMTLAILVSWIVVRSRSRFSWMADVLAFMPHAMPGVVIGLAVLMTYLLIPVPIYGTLWIIVIAMGTQYISLGTRLTTGGIAQIQRSLEEAAEASGASNWQVWRRVLFPLLRPVFINGFLLVLLASVQNLTLPIMLYVPGNQVLSSLIYTRWSGGDVSGTAVTSVVVTVITVIAAIVLRRATGTRTAV